MAFSMCQIFLVTFSKEVLSEVSTLMEHKMVSHPFTAIHGLFQVTHHIQISYFNVHMKDRIHKLKNLKHLYLTQIFCPLKAIYTFHDDVCEEVPPKAHMSMIVFLDTLTESIPRNVSQVNVTSW